MRGRTSLVAIMAGIVCVLGLTGCAATRGNAADLLSVTPDPSASADIAYDNQKLGDCTPLPETTGGDQVSDLRFVGPCGFTERQAVQCVNKTDDFYAYVNRDLPDYGHLSALINVEKYKGPGRYTKNSVIFVQVARNGVLYEWRQTSATLIVSNAGNQVTVGASTVPAVAGGPARGRIYAEGTIVCRP